MKEGIDSAMDVVREYLKEEYDRGYVDGMKSMWHPPYCWRNGWRCPRCGWQYPGYPTPDWQKMPVPYYVDNTTPQVDCVTRNASEVS